MEATPNTYVQAYQGDIRRAHQATAVVAKRAKQGCTTAMGATQVDVTGTDRWMVGQKKRELNERRAECQPEYETQRGNRKEKSKAG